MGKTPEQELLDEFLTQIPDEKLEMSQYQRETLIYVDYVKGYRLDHQGLDDDKREHSFIHRVYVQPVGGKNAPSKRKATHRGSKRGPSGKNPNSNSDVRARCHAADNATP